MVKLTSDRLSLIYDKYLVGQLNDCSQFELILFEDTKDFTLKINNDNIYEGPYNISHGVIILKDNNLPCPFDKPFTINLMEMKTKESYYFIRNVDKISYGVIGRVK
jgi:hypothetical protein